MWKCQDAKQIMEKCVLMNSNDKVNDGFRREMLESKLLRIEQSLMQEESEGKGTDVSLAESMLFKRKI